MSSVYSSVPAPRNGQAKTAQILDGCRALQAQHPGRCFSEAEIDTVARWLTSLQARFPQGAPK